MLKKASVFSLFVLALSACSGQPDTALGVVTSGVAASSSQSGPLSIPRDSRDFTIDAMLFEGDGTWSVEVESLADILSSRGASYRRVNTRELNAMALDDMAQFGALIFPGGTGGTQAGNMSSQTIANLRAAVRERGVSWIGFCAGAFIAVAPTPSEGKNPEYGVAIVDGPVLDYYYLEEELNRRGVIDAAMTLHTFADGTKRDILWYGGPVVPGGVNRVIAKYPNGDAAISQMWSGNGFVILSAGHPAAPLSVRNSFGLRDSDGTDFDLAWKLLSAAIHQDEFAVFAN